MGFSQALDNVGVLGHSLGGFTVLAAAGVELNFDQVMQNCSIEDRDRPSLANDCTPSKLAHN